MTLKPLWRVPDLTEATEGQPPGVEGQHDVVVIGGGLTGLTTALLLARGGQDVLLVEAGRLGRMTTGRSTAKVSLLQGTRLSRLARQHGEEALHAYVEAGREGQAWLRRFCEDHGVPHEERPAYTYATSESGLQRVQDEHRQAAALGLPVRLDHDPPLPFATTGSVVLDGQMQIDPGVLVGALAAEARGQGAVLVEGARAVSIHGTGPYEVETTAGRTTAAAVVVATNYPLADRFGHFAWFTPQRSYALALRGGGVDGMFLSADSPTRSLRDATVDGERHLLLGGQGHVTGRVGSPARELEELREWATTTFPGREETAAWSAQDYSTADGLPWLGPLVPGQSKLVAAGGYAKWGFTTGVAASLALTAHLLDGRIDWAGPLSSWGPRARAIPFAAKNGASAGLEIGVGLVRFLSPGDDEPESRGGAVVRRGWRPAAVSDVDGVERTVSAVCTHMRGIVRWNDAERSWDCPLHGSRFQPDGSVIEGPARCGLRRLE